VLQRYGEKRVMREISRGRLGAQAVYLVGLHSTVYVLGLSPSF
jgi:hypothetical protein